jgi:membrane protease subunit HflK
VLVVGGVAVAVVAAALFTMLYTVEPDGDAVVKRFGKVVRIAGPGLHVKWPFGIETATFVATRRVHKEEFGFQSIGVSQRTDYQKTDADRQVSLMLSGDLNVIDVEWVVQYRVSDPDRFLHRVRDPRGTLRDISEAVMRQVVGNRLGSDVLTVGRASIAVEVRDSMQAILDGYGMGIDIRGVELQDVTPPDRVKPAFNEVNEAQQERERLINEAETFRNQIIPKARGQAQQTIAEAEGYAAARVNRSKGDASRFQAIYAEYSKAPEVTRTRLFLEMVDDVIPKVGRLFVMEPDTTPPLPLLDLDRTTGGGQ